jgi:hypothetical protein
MIDTNLKLAILYGSECNSITMHTFLELKSKQHSVKYNNSCTIIAWQQTQTTSPVEKPSEQTLWICIQNA